MKPETNRSSLRLAPITVFALGLSWAAFPPIHGQTADVLAPSGAPSAATVEERAPAPEAVDETPSRFAGNDIEAYTLARASVFSMRSRDTDPFGLSQDPNARPIVKTTPSQAPIRRLAALPPTPLSDIVKLIRVTTIMPSDKKFLVGIREFSESDEFPLVYQGKRMRMKVTEVSAQRIIFTNLDNGETAPLNTGMLPPGMVAGKESIPPAGMISPVDQLPLDLGSPNPNFSNN